MDQRTYLNILKESLLLCKQKPCLGESFYFYQNSDPKHKAYITWSWLLDNCPHVMDTPAQCPDINSIEYLWRYIDRIIRNHTISSKDDLKRTLQDECAKIQQSFC